MVGMLLPGTGAIYRSQTLTFLLPVYLGETVTAHFVVRSIDRAKHRLEIDAWIENEAGQRVIEGTCEAGLLRMPDAGGVPYGSRWSERSERPPESRSSRFFRPRQGSRIKYQAA